MKLLSILKDEYIGRCPISLHFWESEGLIVKINTILENGISSLETEIIFENVAKFEMTGLYFPEFKYGDYEILNNDNQVESGFYEILDDELFDNQIFDPQGNLDLKRYLVYGYDSYLIIFAQSYRIHPIDIKS